MKETIIIRVDIDVDDRHCGACKYLHVERELIESKHCQLFRCQLSEDGDKARRAAPCIGAMRP